ncbi:Fibronectin 1a [Sparganum proliferum]
MIISNLIGTILLTRIVGACLPDWYDPAYMNPTNLTAVVLNDTSIKFSWEPPKVQKSWISTYEIRLNGWFNQRINKTSVTLHGLRPSTEYKVRVVAIHNRYGLAAPGVSVTPKTSGPYADIKPLESADPLAIPQDLSEMAAHNPASKIDLQTKKQHTNTSFSPGYNFWMSFSAVIFTIIVRL